MKKNYLIKNTNSSISADIKPNFLFKIFVLVALILFGFQNISSQTTFTSGSGNFTVPCDVTSITVEIWGGGGAGGGGNNNNNGGSGGGAGGYSTSTLSVSAGSTIAYSVGTGGIGGNNTGGSGGATTFGALTANGGSGGGPNQGATGTGGTATGGTTNIAGNNGSLGTSTVGAAGGNANGGGGTGGASRNTAGVGNAGTTPGGGGGGGLRTTAPNRAGGDGARGEIRITYTSSLFTYCSPTFTSGMEPITNVTFAGINNTTTNATGGTTYLESFCSVATVLQGQTVPISVKGNTVGNFTDYFRLYVDWNKNGTFGDVANEIYDLGTITNSTGIDATTLSTSILVPVTASLGLTRMRVMKRFNGYSTGPCQTGAGYGQGEDYSVNVVAPPTITSLSAASGCVGSSLIITGTNLTGATAASIGGTAATITANTATSITVTVGSGTTGTVSITTPGGTATSASTATPTFTVNPLPASISGSATVCIGGTITLTDATSGGTWGITNVTGSATISGTGDVSGISAGTVTVSYTLPTTCSVTTAVTVQQAPGAIAGGSSTVCVGSATPAFTNPVSGGTWSVTNGTGAATITAGGVLTGTSAGTVTVSYTIGSCTPVTFALTVDPTPVAISGVATVCTGAITTLTDGTPGGTWGITNGTGSATISATGDVSGITAGTVTVSYTLLPTTCNVIKSITVQQTPGAIAGGASAVCVGSATPAFTNPNAGGTWSVVNGTGTATITTPAGVLTGTGAGTVTVNYTIGACTPATYTVTVNPTPVAISGAATVCTGSTTTLTDATPGGTWGITNVTGSATISATGDVSGITAGTVTVSYTLLPNCSITKSITVQQTPGAIAGGAATICVNSSTPAFTNPNAGGTWSVVNGTGAATITAGGVLTGTSAGTVTVNYTIGACTPATYAVTVNPIPAVISGAATVCTGTTTTLTDATAGGTWGITNVTGSATITAGGIVSGVTAGTVTASYTLTPTGCNVTKSITVQQTPGAIAGGATTVCAGYSTPAFTNPNAGGTWSVVNGTGAATITAGGVLTGTSAGNVTVNYTIGACTPATFAVTVNPTPSVPASPVNSAITSTGFTVTWSASAGAINYIFEVYTDAGYTTPISGSPFTLASPTVNYTVSGLATGPITYYYRIKATNATCSSAYVTGTVTTILPNDDCSGAVLLSVSNSTNCTTSASSTTTGATQSLVGCTGTADDDVWFRFIATGTTHTVTVTPGTLNNAVFEVFNGSCGGASLGCINNTGGANIETTTLTGLTSGVTYYVRVYSNGNATNTGTFSICITSFTNDECSGATPLTVSTTCSYSTYTNAGATSSTGMTAPGCANYSGGDVWFSVVVPATGEIDVDMQTGVMTDSGMALYSGTCGALTLLDCDDDSSTNGLMSSLNLTGLNPGDIIYIRVWEYGNDNNGTFGICVTTPSCPSPSNLYSNILSTTSVTVGWTASSAASGGYQYYINTTGTAPTAGTTPTGTTPAGVISVTLTGLTPGLKYYFWVRSFCGGVDVSSWYGPTNYTPCAVGNGTGTTTLGCTSPIAGGIGLSGNDPAALTCSALTCPTLEVSYLPLKQTTDYTVSSIPYAPPYQYTCLQTPVSVNIDDVWSPTINLPFNFCYYGNNYNKCLIGSNGVITFDTTTNSPGGYNTWSFSSNLPNTALFKNTIFGVYQDIDPSKGGQVGYELITLNTGCRALVASWNNIPMYSSSCNAQLYTGMIVLYENTNVIDVYIKEKNICSTWNGGNAIVGVQNAAGTAAVVAPGRNGLDTDWSVAVGSGEAWRFTPNGPSINPTVQWYQGSVATGTPIPGPAGTSATLSVCPTVTTSYTAEVTYPLCTGNLKVTDNVLVTVNGNKIWNGVTSTDWNTASNWTPNGVPTNAHCVVIPVTSRNPIISAAPDAVGYNLNVYANAALTINSNQNLTITDKVTTSGIFTINNSASLIQINNVLNSGNIIYKRDAPSVRTLDYVYWSSPVAGFNVSNIVSPYTFGLIYKWNTTIPNSNAGWGLWQSAAGNTMVPGKGYIARTPGASPFNNSTYNVLNGTFTGVPNNGNITIPIERGPDQITAVHSGTNGTQITNYSDNWNLLGNPYPSSIRGSQFLFDNNTKIEGNIRLWTHGTLPSLIEPSPFYGSYLSNYTPGDYLTYNFTGTSCCPTAASDLFIGAGQGFFVQMVDGTPVSVADNVTVAFNNNLRSATYSNSTFYKAQNTTTSSSTIDVDDLERNRIWLDLINPNNQTDRILFGYIQNATMGRDSFYDCITQNTGASLIYSLVDDTKFSIQGRALPFDINDEVPIGMNASIQGNYKIGIAAVDGLFNNQNIYLKDNLLNITHDLKASPYTFTSQTGEINDRFKIIYIDNALGNPGHNLDNTVKVIVNNEVAVSSGNLQMESIIVYNVLGQKLATYKGINTNYFTLSNLSKNNTTLLLKIKLQTGEIVIKKIIY